MQLGLCNNDPVTFDVAAITPRINDIAAQQKLMLGGKYEISFNPKDDIRFLFTESLPFHPNALTFLTTLADGRQIAETFYSIGGGFIVRENEPVLVRDVRVPFRR